MTGRIAKRIQHKKKHIQKGISSSRMFYFIIFLLNYLIYFYTFNQFEIHSRNRIF